MAYNEELAARVRIALAPCPDVEEKNMMGGIVFMVKSKMCVGINKDDLMCRIGPEAHEKALQQKGCREMDFTGKAMKGFVFVAPEGTAERSSLQYWVDLALAYNATAKASIKKRTKKKKAPKE